MLTGDLDYPDFKHLPGEDEAVVLRTLLETFISRAWCLRQPCDGTAMPTFPQINNPRWADYWQQQAYAVMLIILTSDGEIRWMDVSADLDHSNQSSERFLLEGIFSREPWDSSRDCRFR